MPPFPRPNNILSTFGLRRTLDRSTTVVQRKLAKQVDVVIAVTLEGVTLEMIPPLPFPTDYGISEKYGFLSDEAALEVLPDPYYKEWESVVANLQALLLSKRLKRRIETLPIVTALRLRTNPEWRRAYTLLSFMTHAYIWGGDQPEEV